MTPERRAEIEEMLDQLTPGEWFYETAGGSVQSRTIESDGWVNEDIVYYIVNADQDGPFLAASPAIIRELLAEIDRLSGGIRAFTDAVVYGPRTDYERHRMLYALVGLELVFGQADESAEQEAPDHDDRDNRHHRREDREGEGHDDRPQIREPDPDLA